MALTEKLTNIGNAIREKNGTTDLIPLTDMPQAILNIVSGSGTEYTNIEFKEDNTIELTDTDGVVHTMECEYTDGKLTSVKYDGNSVALKYEGDALVGVGETVVDLSGVEDSGVKLLDNTVTFTVDGEPYEIVSVKSGNSVNAPTVPQIEGKSFSSWNVDGVPIEFPYLPDKDTEIYAVLSTVLDKIYNHYGYTIQQYSQILIQVTSKGSIGRVIFGNNLNIYYKSGSWNCNGYDVYILPSGKVENITDTESLCNTILNNSYTIRTETSVSLSLDNAEVKFFANFDLSKFCNRDYIRL